MSSEAGTHVADCLEIGHLFTVPHPKDSDRRITWQLSGEKPITDKIYKDFSIAVYNCEKVSAHKENAVVKIWMQTRSEDDDSQDNSPDSKSGYIATASVLTPAWDKEVEALEKLNQDYEKLRLAAEEQRKHIQFKPFPSFLGLAKDKQPEDENFPVYKGYLIFLVMEKLPGDCISEDDYWEWQKKERDEFREAFEKSFRFIEKMRIANTDLAMRNLLYDRSEKKWLSNTSSYLIDWESWRECDPNDPYPQNRLLASYGLIQDLGARAGCLRWVWD
ncbi:hypothetical protein CJF32_00008449 [Rutstroemia sp. NJR-2017a WRK4]|nr:hypothetical protein CJF32_00008449 [Rutstroemia sp. NJR-2017a WRK4]